MSKVLIALCIMSVLLVSCGPKKASNKKEADQPPEQVSPEPRALETGPIQIELKNEKLEKQWFVQGKKSQLTYVEGKATGTLTGASGKFFRAGEVVSTFKADRADADQIREIINATGRVVVTSVENKTRVSADRIRRVSKLDFIVAMGNVRVDGPTFQMDPTEVLVASSDLSEIGTPDQFKGRIEGLIPKE